MFLFFVFVFFLFFCFVFVFVCFNVFCFVLFVFFCSMLLVLWTPWSVCLMRIDCDCCFNVYNTMNFLCSILSGMQFCIFVFVYPLSKCM